MFRLLQPAALWTLVACALPWAIHLWRRPPRTVRLGSLRFLGGGARHPWRNLRWRELLLLALRLALLVALSILLAGPRWLTLPPAGPRRWALLDPTARLQGESLARWQTLQNAGYELHRLTLGFPVSAAEAATDEAPAPDLWSLLREADAELPAGSTLAVFSPGRLAALRGTRPALGHCHVEWIATPDIQGDAPHVWVASAAAKRIVAGRSDAHSATFATVAPPEPVVFPGDGGERWKTETRVEPEGVSARIWGRENHPEDSPGPWSLARPVAAARSILILHDAAHTSDARYAEAAVRAAAASSGRAVNLQTRDINPDVDNAPPTDWIFWLSESPVPAGLAERAPRLLRYSGGEPIPVQDWIVAPPGDPADGARLWKLTVAPTPPVPGVIVWRDGRGDPVLSHSRVGAGERWDLFTRFDPTWTDLPATTALPAWTRALLFPEVGAESLAGPVHDRRIADASQGQPSESGAAVVIPALAPVDQRFLDLHGLLWTLAGLMFAAERLLSLWRRSAPPAVRPSFRSEPVAAVSR